MKRLAVFLDGTWNTLANNTNVWRLRALCAADASDLWFITDGWDRVWRAVKVADWLMGRPRNPDAYACLPYV